MRERVVDLTEIVVMIGRMGMNVSLAPAKPKPHGAVPSDLQLKWHELEIYARSLPGSYGQERVCLIHAQPTQKLVKEITEPSIPYALGVTFHAWPKSLKDLVQQMAARVKDQP